MTKELFKEQKYENIYGVSLKTLAVNRNVI